MIVCGVFLEQEAPSEGGLWGGVLEDVSLKRKGAGDAAVLVRGCGAWLLGWGGGSSQDHQGQDFWGAEEDGLGGAGPAVTWSHERVTAYGTPKLFSARVECVQAAQACEQEVTLSKASKVRCVSLCCQKKQTKHVDKVPPWCSWGSHCKQWKCSLPRASYLLFSWSGAVVNKTLSFPASTCNAQYRAAHWISLQLYSGWFVYNCNLDLMPPLLQYTVCTFVFIGTLHKLILVISIFILMQTYICNVFLIFVPVTHVAYFCAHFSCYLNTCQGFTVSVGHTVFQWHYTVHYCTWHVKLMTVICNFVIFFIFYVGIILESV